MGRGKQCELMIGTEVYAIRKWFFFKRTVKVNRLFIDGVELTRNNIHRYVFDFEKDKEVETGYYQDKLPNCEYTEALHLETYKMIGFSFEYGDNWIRPKFSFRRYCYYFFSRTKKLKWTKDFEWDQFEPQIIQFLKVHRRTNDDDGKEIF